MKLIASTSALKPADFIIKTVGSLLFIYYSYVDRFHIHPRDMDDLVDGLLYIEAKDYVENTRKMNTEGKQ